MNLPLFWDLNGDKRSYGFLFVLVLKPWEGVKNKMTQDEGPDRNVTRRTALKKGALVAGVFTVSGTATSISASAEDTGRGVLRKRDLERGYEIGSILTAVETVDDIEVEQPAGLLGGETQKLEEASLIKRPLYSQQSCPPQSPRPYTPPPCGKQGSNLLTELWPSNGVADIGNKLKITDAEELPTAATIRLQGPNGVIESTKEPMVEVTFKKLHSQENRVL